VGLLVAGIIKQSQCQTVFAGFAEKSFSIRNDRLITSYKKSTSR